jgi:hypothetical protein
MDEPHTVEWLISELGADHGERSMDARAELMGMGREHDVVGPLLRALPGMDRWEQLCVIEIVEELDDRRADGPLITLLDSEHDTVRAWSAEALARRQVTAAVPAIRRAYQACLDRGDDPDLSEPAGLRDALADLGAVIPE